MNVITLENNGVSLDIGDIWIVASDDNELESELTLNGDDIRLLLRWLKSTPGILSMGEWSFHAVGNELNINIQAARMAIFNLDDFITAMRAMHPNKQAAIDMTMPIQRAPHTVASIQTDQ